MAFPEEDNINALEKAKFVQIEPATADQSNSKRVAIASEQPVLHRIEETISSVKTFIGETYDVSDANPDKSAAIWRIKRITIVGQQETVSWAGEGKFNQVWDDRETIFVDPPFTSAISTNFDGVNDYINFGNNFNYDISTAFSISLWIKPQNLAATRSIFSKAGPTPSVTGWMLRHDITTGALFYQMRGGNNRSHTSTATLTAGVWQHLVFTYAGGDNINGALVYVNASVGDTPASGAIGGTMLVGQDFLIGQRNAGFYFSGNIDEVTIWTKALGPAEVTELYNSGTPSDPTIHSAAANLTSFYKCGDGDTFPVWSDNVGVIDGTMTNMASDDFESDVP